MFQKESVIVVRKTFTKSRHDVGRVAALTRSSLIGSWIIQVVKVAANEIVGIASRARMYVL